MQVAPLATSSTVSYFRLSENFLAPYRLSGDPFESLLARSAYVTKYCRTFENTRETWTDTIRRVVEGNVNLAYGVSETEAEMLFHLFWTGQALPPGRGLWTGGVPGMVPDARFNCWNTSIRDIDDWCWAADRLMLGGGVGASLHNISDLPEVKAPGRFAIWCRGDHPNLDEVSPEGPSFLNGSTPKYVCDDSREGWVLALRKTLVAAFNGEHLIVDVSNVRARGEAIRTFGGVACGPGPLADLLRAVWNIVQGALGRKLTSVEALDITTHIGMCIKSGNVRRSAILMLGSPEDTDFRNAKKSFADVVSHRQSANNSIGFTSWEQIDNFDWVSLVDDVVTFGEPGLVNLPLCRRYDPFVTGVNPCGEVALRDREACNLAEVFPGKFMEGTNPATVFRLVTRYTLRQRLVELIDPRSNSVQKQTMRLGVSLGGVCDFNWTPSMLAEWYGLCRKEADEYADDLGVSRPIAVTAVKPSGTISLLNGSSPGMHAPHAPYYIRRIRVDKDEPMATALMDAGVHYDQDVGDKTGRLLAFAFPMKSDSPVTKENDSLRGQFERQVALQSYWADNAVSATLNFNPDTERGELASCLKEYFPKLKSTSMLATYHGYSLAPYETIDEDTYRRMYAEIDHRAPLASGGDVEIEECAGGVCPIR